MSTGEFLLYTTEDGVTKLEVRMVDETVWLSLTQMVELSQRDKSVISRHIRNIYEEGELVPQATVANFATVQREGARAVGREVTHLPRPSFPPPPPIGVEGRLQRESSSRLP